MKVVLEKTRAVLTAAGLAAALVGACSSERTEGTNTNWVACDGDANCVELGAGFTCVANRCVAGGDPDGGRDAPTGSGGSENLPEGSPGPVCVTRAAPDSTFASASAETSACRSLGAQGESVLRCGALDAVLSQYVDTVSTTFYDAAGRPVGASNGGLTTEPRCITYDPSFTSVPDDCVAVTPACEDAGWLGSCKPAPSRPADTWQGSGRGFAECGSPGSGGKLQYRCGDLDMIYEPGRGGWTERYYGQTGKLVGEIVDGFFVTGVCRTFSTSFTERPTDCVQVTPPCEGGVPGGDGGGGGS
ncbi:MAG: hypothetical protein FJ104_06980 [Deltaproteobacteria bacterium]|nr:hypothetical protein [Deltaproteobacteria bacterium]